MTGDRWLQELVESWDDIPDDSKVHVVAIVRSLAAGFTGEVSLQCNDGGVGDHFQRRRVRAADVQTGPDR